MPESVTSVFCASATVFTGDFFEIITILISGEMRPIQFSCAVLKRTPWVPSFSSSAMVGAQMAMEVPSLAATEAM